MNENPLSDWLDGIDVSGFKGEQVDAGKTDIYYEVPFILESRVKDLCAKWSEERRMPISEPQVFMICQILLEHMAYKPSPLDMEAAKAMQPITNDLHKVCHESPMIAVDTAFLLGVAYQRLLQRGLGK